MCSGGARVGRWIVTRGILTKKVTFKEEMKWKSDQENVLSIQNIKLKSNHSI